MASEGLVISPPGAIIYAQSTLLGAGRPGMSPDETTGVARGAVSDNGDRPKLHFLKSLTAFLKTCFKNLVDRSRHKDTSTKFLKHVFRKAVKDLRK